jgi:hypothetical protein
LASPLFPQSAFIKELFPTFDRPIKAYSGIIGFGQSFQFGLLIMKLADLIFIA